MSQVAAGTHFSFRPQDPDAPLPVDWRELDRAVWRWVRAHGGSPLVALAAGHASNADGAGHSALPLAMLRAAGDVCQDQLDVALRGSDLVDVRDGQDAIGRPVHAAARPFVLDRGHLYLQRNFRAETAVAEAIVQRRRAPRGAVAPLEDADLLELFGGRLDDAEARQRDAVRAAPGKRFVVLTGGPGTGKTTTVLRMLLGLSRDHSARAGALPRLQLSAPTGKAAQRLAQAIATGGRMLVDQGLPDQWQPHLAGALSAGAGTVHRLLGSRGIHGGFRHHAGASLPLDILVVDEASMLDLGQLRAVLEALPHEAVLVLVGDADQLTSVGTGSVMMDIVAAMQTGSDGDGVDRARPGGDLIRLRHCFRADQTLVPLFEAVRSGDTGAFEAALPPAAHPAGASTPARVRHRDTGSARVLARAARDWADLLAADLDAAGLAEPVAIDDQDRLAARLSLLHRRQLLCALREGPEGALQVGAVVAARVRQAGPLAAWDGQPWYPGRRVIVTRNDASAGLFNGDAGLCVLVHAATRAPFLQVAFPATSSSGAGGSVRLFDPHTLPPHEDAFALTIHKSQGSEYAQIAVLLPSDPDSPLLARQTLYTGLSRARNGLELWATRDALRTAIARPLQRHGLLSERIRAAFRGRVA